MKKEMTTREALRILLALRLTRRSDRFGLRAKAANYLVWGWHERRRPSEFPTTGEAGKLMKKVTLNITVEMEFDDNYPLATSLEDCHTVGGRAASRAWYSLAELISDWYPRECYVLDGEIRTGPMAGYDSRLEGEVTKVEVVAGDKGCLGYAEVSRDEVRSGLFVTVNEGVRS